MKVCVVMGTRPGIIKMAPVYLALNAMDPLDVGLLYTGQHYSSTLKASIMGAFDLPEPSFVIDGVNDCKTHATQISRMMIGCEEIFLENRPDVVLVCGDANTNLAAGLAARKSNTFLCHVESGLRSNDWSMPEEHNRVMLDHISDVLFAPTDLCSENLKKENVMGEIHVVGNTIVDSLNSIVQSGSIKKPDIDIPSSFALATSHRQENVDDPDRLRSILTSINMIDKTGLNVIFPLHPRTDKMIKKFGFDDFLSPSVIVVPPVKYEEMLWLISNAEVVLSDSGGLQEEACVLGTPCVTLRDNTERPESVHVGANIVAGVEPDNVFSAFQEHLAKKASGFVWDNPFGSGNTGLKIAELILEKANLSGSTLR